MTHTLVHIVFTVIAHQPQRAGADVAQGLQFTEAAGGIVCTRP